MDHELLESLKKWKVVPIITLKTPDKALKLAQTFKNNGLPVLELTLRYPGSSEAVRRIREHHPDMLVGAGTVLSLELAQQAVKAGSQFVVSPAFNPDVVKFCLDQGVPVFPGVNNPTHLYEGLCLGATHFKIFPAEAAGGAPFLKALQGPFPTARFFPTGGINHSNMNPYLELPSVLAVGCGDMSPEHVLEQEDWEELGRRVRIYRQAAGLEPDLSPTGFKSTQAV